MLGEGNQIQQLATQSKLSMPILAVGAGGGDFTRHTMSQVTDQLSAATLEGVGHYAAMEASVALSHSLLGFYRTVEW